MGIESPAKIKALLEFAIPCLNNFAAHRYDMVSASRESKYFYRKDAKDAKSAQRNAPGLVVAASHRRCEIEIFA
jgi:hypothetical protein